jgi:REP element-mobilizing transposase RayT
MPGCHGSLRIVSRSLRSQVPGLTYHVTTHGVEEAAIFRTEQDCETFVKHLTVVAERYCLTFLAVSMQDTHYHLLVMIEKENLAAAMQYLNGGYAAVFNRTHGRRGHLFGARYHNKPVFTEAHLLSTIRYIARNRTAAGAAPDPVADRRSSYAGVIGERACWPCVDRHAVLEHFGDGAGAVLRLREFVEGP